MISIDIASRKEFNDCSCCFSKASDLSKSTALEWCAGTQQLWEVDGPNPCEVLATGFDRLSGGHNLWRRTGGKYMVKFQQIPTDSNEIFGNHVLFLG